MGQAPSGRRRVYPLAAHSPRRGRCGLPKALGHPPRKVLPLPTRRLGPSSWIRDGDESERFEGVLVEGFRELGSSSHGQ